MDLCEIGTGKLMQGSTYLKLRVAVHFRPMLIWENCVSVIGLSIFSSGIICLIFAPSSSTPS